MGRRAAQRSLTSIGTGMAATVVVTLAACGSRGDVRQTVPTPSRDGQRVVASAPTVTSVQLDIGLTGVAVAFGSVWVSTPTSITRLDPTSQAALATIQVSDASVSTEFAVTGDALWVGQESGNVRRIDPATNSLVATIPVERTIVGVTAGGGSVWVITVNLDGSWLWQISPESNSVVSGPLDFPGDGGSGVHAAGVLWVMSGDGGGHLTRVDTSEVRVLPGIPWGDRTSGALALHDQTIWGLNDYHAIALDPRTGDVLGRIPVTDGDSLAGGDDGLWVWKAPGSTSTRFYDPDPSRPERVVQLDPVALRVVPETETELGFSPSSFAVGAGALWVTNDEGLLWHVDPA